MSPAEEWATYPLYCPLTGMRLIHSPNSLRMFDANPQAWYLRYQLGVVPPELAGIFEEDGGTPRSKGAQFAQCMKVGLECVLNGGRWEEGQREARCLAEDLGMTSSEIVTVGTWWSHYPPFKNLRYVEQPFFLPTSIYPRGSQHQFVIFGICDVVADRMILDHKTSAKTFRSPHHEGDPYPSPIMNYMRSWQVLLYASVSQLEWGFRGKVCLDTIRWPLAKWDGELDTPQAPQYDRWVHHFPIDSFHRLHEELELTFAQMQLFKDRAFFPRRKPTYPLGPEWETLLDQPMPEKVGVAVDMEHPVQRWLEHSK